MELSSVNQPIGLYKEGTQQAEEALGIYERLGNTANHAHCLIRLAFLLRLDNQFDAAEESACRAISLLAEKGQEFLACESYRALGKIYQSKGDIGEAIHHFEVAIGIATPFNWHNNLFWLHYGLVELLLHEGRFGDVQAHIEHAKSHTADNTYHLGRAMELQARVWYDQHKFEETRSEILRAAEVFKKVGAAKNLEDCKHFLRDIEKGLSTLVTSGQSD